MMRTWTLCLLAAALCCPAFGANAEQELMKIEKEMLDAALKGDVSASEKYVSDGLVWIGPNGMMSDKASLMRDMKSGELKLESATFDEAKVRVYGEAAIVTYASTDKGTYKGQDISGRTRWTDVFVRQNGRWMLVSSHGSAVMQ